MKPRRAVRADDENVVERVGDISKHLAGLVCARISASEKRTRDLLRIPPTNMMRDQYPAASAWAQRVSVERKNPSEIHSAPTANLPTLASLCWTYQCPSLGRGAHRGKVGSGNDGHPTIPGNSEINRKIPPAGTDLPRLKSSFSHVSPSNSALFVTAPAATEDSHTLRRADLERNGMRIFHGAAVAG